jgi:hypothetical protein
MRAAIERFLRLLATKDGQEIDWVIEDDSIFTPGFRTEWSEVVEALETALRDDPSLRSGE